MIDNGVFCAVSVIFQPYIGGHTNSVTLKHPSDSVSMVTYADIILHLKKPTICESALYVVLVMFAVIPLVFVGKKD